MVKCVALIAAALCLLVAACGNGGVVQGVVAHKTVTGVKDGTSYTILVNRPGDGSPWISVEDPELEGYFSPNATDAVITESLERLLMATYSEVHYYVNVRVPSVESGTKPYRASREIFNAVRVDDQLKFRVSGSDLPQIAEVLEQSQTARKGVLQGTVTIGPIWPVERPGGNPPIPPEVYQARKIVVYDEHRTKLIEQVDIVPNGDYGSYRIELNPGNYIVDINHLGIDSSGDVPVEVEIGSGETVELNIDIDTGIR